MPSFDTAPAIPSVRALIVDVESAVTETFPPDALTFVRAAVVVLVM